MNIVILAGIYPPELGGPATYSQALARELVASGHTVTVLAYSEVEQITEDGFSVECISRKGTFLLRYLRFLLAIRKYSSADIFYNFGTVSTGIPLLFSGVIRYKKVLRLGGDFAWERYTDWGGRQSLVDFYKNPSVFWRCVQWCIKPLIRQHKHVIFSTEWQQNIYRSYIALPSQSCIENALHVPVLEQQHHTQHSPVRLLSYGRLVAFKNLDTLITAMSLLPHAHLTIVGSGPCKESLQKLVESSVLEQRVSFVGDVKRTEQANIFAQHDILVIPSISDISPNTALEARAHGLPVIISNHNGLSAQLQSGMYVCNTDTPQNIVTAIEYVCGRYAQYANTQSIVHRTWQQVAKEHEILFTTLHK